MAKETLGAYLNRNIKELGSSLSKEKAKGKQYKSISAAKKAGALYYTNKAGKIMAAVYGEDLKDRGSLDKTLKGVIISPRPKLRPKGLDKKKPSRAATESTEKTEPQKRKEARMANSPGKGSDEPITRKNKGGPVTKKPKGAYAAGGSMPMVMKGGTKVPAFAADGKGKMNMGGMAKKKPAAKMMAGGMAKKKPAAKKMMAGGMAKKSGYMYGGMAKKKK